MTAVNTKVNIRPAAEQEEDRFVELSCGLTRFNRKNGPELHDEDLVMSQRRDQARKLFRDSDPNRIILFGEVEGQVAGYTIARIYRPSLATETLDPIVGNVDELYVDPQIRSKGLGSKLLEEAADWMRQEGATRMTLSMYAWNDDAARFYRKAGFEIYDVTWQKEL